MDVLLRPIQRFDVPMCGGHKFTILTPRPISQFEMSLVRQWLDLCEPELVEIETEQDYEI